MSKIIYHKKIALLNDDSHFTKWVKETGRLDHDQRLLQRVKPYLSGTVIDVGANIGTHAVFYANYSPRVICFEANPVVFKCLEYNVPSAELYCIALGSHPHKVSLITPPPVNDPHYPGINYGASWTVPGEDIKVQTLDYYMKNLDITNCTFIKIDVEGDEREVLNGALKLITRDRPTMLIEVNDSTLVRKGLTKNNIYEWLYEHHYTWKHSEGYENGISDDILCSPNSP